MSTVRVVFNNQEILKRSLDKDVCTIGRQEGCDIHIDNLGISRVHARFIQEERAYAIEDMNSSNGTYVNGQPVKRQTLNHGDQITIGKFTLIYESDSQKTIAEAPPLAAVAPAGAKPLPLPGDMLGTMQMDGEAIRKRIGEMQKQQKPPASPASASIPPAAEKPDSTATPSVKPAVAPMAATGSGASKIVIACLVVAVLVLAVLAAYLATR